MAEVYPKSGTITPKILSCQKSMPNYKGVTNNENYIYNLQYAQSSFEIMSQKNTFNTEMLNEATLTLQNNKCKTNEIENIIKNDKATLKKQLDNIQLIKTTLEFENKKTYFNDPNIIYLEEYNDDFSLITHIAINNELLHGMNNKYYDIVHPIDNDVIQIAVEHIHNNHDGVIIDILTNHKNKECNYPDVHSVILYTFQNKIYLIDPNDSDFSKKILEDWKNIYTIELKKLCSYDNDKNNYRDCTDISIKILSCLNHCKNELTDFEKLQKIICYHTRTDICLQPSIKSILTLKNRFTTNWDIRKTYMEIMKELIEYRKKT